MRGQPSNLEERFVSVGGHRTRIWQCGTGEPVGILAGLGGLPTWTEFLDRLSRRRRVVVPSLPGFPGSEGGHERLDDVVDWIAATLDLLEAADLVGADLVGLSVGGMLAAETVALGRAVVRRLVLVSPYGLFDENEPPSDVFACPVDDLPSLLCADPAAADAVSARPEACDEVEWSIVATRAAAAAAHLLWPLADRGLGKRLHRVVTPTLVVWGENDRVLSSTYARRFADGLGGPVHVEIVARAGHRVDLDQPTKLAAIVDAYLGDGGKG